MSRGERAAVAEDWEGILPDEAVSFPPDFIWGVASSAFQAEGGQVANDWVAMADMGLVDANPGNGFWQRFAEDFSLLRSFGIRHYRLSVEWSRVEPERGRFDEAAIDHYRAVCEAALSAGITPWVNFYHFTRPLWFRERGDFQNAENEADFLRYVERVTRALAGSAKHFHSQNESLLYAQLGWRFGQMPPFVHDDEQAWSATLRMLWLHAGTYRVIKSIDADAKIGPVEAYLDFHPADPNSEADRTSVDRADYWFHRVFWEGLATGRVTSPEARAAEVEGLAGAADFYGLNYYSASRIGSSGHGSHADREGRPRDGMGRYVHPQGLERGLRRAAEALPGMPLLVTENGCPTTDERFRIRYLAAHLAALDRVRRSGIDVGGYFHWTAVDNYEWGQGMDRTPFGLIAFDRETGERRPKASASWLGEVIAAGRIDPGSIP
jgi:beta-glucosidase